MSTGSRPFRLRNTLTGRVEPFSPARPREVRMYTCGLTVYARGHIGNFRTFVAQDVLRRFLRFKGYRVVQAMNFTDVDDKTIRGANEAGLPLRQYTDRFIGQFFDDADALGIERAEHNPRATDPRYIKAMAALVERLLEKGIAYRADGSVYFRVAAFPAYGRLSGAGASDRIAGARVDSDEYDKEHAHDFALWKAAKPDEPSWPASFGRGRPGWHLECSAMGLELLGSDFDLHCGGVDLVFPHHENEIAQSEAATGKPFVRHWFHCEHLLVEGRKMSKSLGNQFTVRDLLDEGFSAAAMRHLLAGVHYRQQLNFTRAGLRQAQVAIGRVNAFLARSDRAGGGAEAGDGTAEDAEVAGALDRFEAALDDDLNTSRALAEVFFALKQGNRALHQQGAAGGTGAAPWAAAIRRMNEVIGSFELGKETSDRAVGGERDEQEAPSGLAPELLSRIEERAEARRRRDFARADAIRDELAQEGILLEDGPRGTTWRRP